MIQYPRDALASEGMTKALGGASMEQIVAQKQCVKCGEVKAISEFGRNSRKVWKKCLRK